MRLKPNHIYLIIIAVLFSAGYSIAQESVSPVLEGMEAEKPNGGIDYNLIEGEGSAQRIQSTSPNSTPSSQRDSIRTKAIQTKPKTTQKPSGEAQPKPEESMLGFNFLYYIFQKYKMSDIID